MRKKAAIQAFVMLAAGLASFAACANWYAVTSAYQAKELTNACGIFRELAERF